MGKRNYQVLDGLTRGFGPRTTDDNVPADVSTSGAVRQLVIELEDLTVLPLNTAASAAGAAVNSATLPANSSVQSVTVITKTAATSSGAADLLLGVYTKHATSGALVAVDEDGLAAAGDSALADFSVAGETIVLGKAAGAALIGKTTVGAAPVIVAPAYATAAYTGGALQVIIEYVLAA